jgi:hypothetical protein
MKYLLLIALIIAGAYYWTQNNKVEQLKRADAHPTVLELTSEIDTRSITLNDTRTLMDAFYKTPSEEGRAGTLRLAVLSLMSTNPSAIPALRQKIEREYPDKGYFDFMDQEFPQSCASCSGKGSAPCTRCKGDTKCTNIKCEKGEISYEGIGETITKKCPICRGTDQCSVCTGTGLSTAPCTKCLGTGKNYNRTDATERYRESIKGLQ